MIKTFANAIIENQISSASIINIASIVGKYGNIGQANYCASKAGVELLTKTAAKEFGKFSIRCNAILPGFIKSPMTDIIPEKVKEKFIPLIPCGRFGDPNGKVSYRLALTLRAGISHTVPLPQCSRQSCL